LLISNSSLKITDNSSDTHASRQLSSGYLITSATAAAIRTAWILAGRLSPPKSPNRAAGASGAVSSPTVA
jgi:hypothetical protein